MSDGSVDRNYRLEFCERRWNAAAFGGRGRGAAAAARVGNINERNRFASSARRCYRRAKSAEGQEEGAGTVSISFSFLCSRSLSPRQATIFPVVIAHVGGEHTQGVGRLHAERIDGHSATWLYQSCDIIINNISSVPPFARLNRGLVCECTRPNAVRVGRIADRRWKRTSIDRWSIDSRYRRYAIYRVNYRAADRSLTLISLRAVFAARQSIRDISSWLLTHVDDS